MSSLFEAKQTYTLKQDAYVAEMRIHCADASMYASRKVGAVWANATFHKSGAWLSITVNECPSGGRTRSTSVAVCEPAARELYAILHATYGAER